MEEANSDTKAGGGGGVRRILRTISSMHIAALVFLTCSSAVAAYGARSDPWTLAFIGASYGTLMLLFWCLHTLESSPPEIKRKRLKLAIWVLAMSLNSMFACRVAPMVPFRFAVAVWAVAGFTTVTGFYTLLDWGKKSSDA